MSKTLQEPKIEFAERYDQEEDIFYVTFKTGEPSWVLEHDDIILVEIGVYTGMPTGFRILDFTKNKQSAFERVGSLLKATAREAKINANKGLQDRESYMREFLQKITA